MPFVPVREGKRAIKEWEPLDDETRATLEAFADSVQRGMRRRGWEEGGRYEIKRLAAEMGMRWQSVQFWIVGPQLEPGGPGLRSLPTAETIKRLQAVLDMTPAEFYGLARGSEPTNAAWKAFLLTAEGASMNADEKRLVGGRIYLENQEPTVSSYLFELAAVRATTTRKD
jgi:hypothetical protein